MLLAAATICYCWNAQLSKHAALTMCFSTNAPTNFIAFKQKKFVPI